MADKIVLNSVASFQNDTSAVVTINNNNALVTSAIDNTLSRDGTTPNQMLSNLDMNSNQILNLPAPATTSSPARLADVVTNPTITVPPIGTSGATVPLLNGNNTWSGTQTFLANSIGNTALAQMPATTLKGNSTGSTANVSDLTSFKISGSGQFGTTSYAAINSYAGGVGNSLLFSARGAISSEVTDEGATAVFQSVGKQTSGTGTSLYSSYQKESSTAFSGGRAFWAESVDSVGGTNSFVEGLRSTAVLAAGTGGNASGLVSLAITTVPYAYLIGHESQAFNLSGTAATTTFSSAKFSAGAMTTCGQNSGVACDAGFMTNPFSNTPFISGVLITNASVSDTAFRNDATLVNGLDLSRGTYSGDQIKGPGFSVNGPGTILSVANATSTVAGGIPGLTFGVAQIAIFYGSGVPTATAPQGSLYLRTDGSSTSTRMYVNTNGTTGWTAVTTAA